MNTRADLELKRCCELINSIKKGILITRNIDNMLKGRPMFTAKVDEECNIWFYTRKNSEKINQISKNNQVFLVYTNPSNNSFLTVRGCIVIDEDKENEKEFLSRQLKQWLPQGCEVADIVLLKVIPEEVEFWDGSMNKFTILFNLFYSFAEGENYHASGHCN
jgi:general stress protein 26